MNKIHSVARSAAIVATVFFAAIFGFFYAWICSTMWGLDASDPRVAIEAMQAMNASVRNAVFFPAFFLTPLVGLLAAGVLRRAAFASSAAWFLGASIVYALGGMALTLLINVPMNEALAQLDIPPGRQAAVDIWQAYSPRWQFWNTVRTIASGVALVLAAIGLMRLSPPPPS